MTDQIPAVPQFSTGPNLVAAVNDRIRRINSALSAPQTATKTATGAFIGTHAQRLGRPVEEFGVLYTESDRGVIYQSQGTFWKYLGGVMTAAWASLPADLGLNDAGFTFYDNVSSLHVWQWTGTAWTWGPGDRHSGEFGTFDADPGLGWHLCDGSINQTKYAAAGTRVTNFTVPDQRGFYLKAAGSYTGTGVPAVAPGLTGSTAATTHSHALSAANAPISAIAATATAAVPVVTAAGVNVAAQAHTHPAPTISGATDAESAHVHAKGTLAVDAAGVPATFAVLPYYRL